MGGDAAHDPCRAVCVAGISYNRCACICVWSGLCFFQPTSSPRSPAAISGVASRSMRQQYERQHDGSRLHDHTVYGISKLRCQKSPCLRCGFVTVSAFHSVNDMLHTRIDTEFGWTPWKFFARHTRRRSRRHRTLYNFSRYRTVQNFF